MFPLLLLTHQNGENHPSPTHRNPNEKFPNCWENNRHLLVKVDVNGPGQLKSTKY